VTYDAEVLADSPWGYWKCDETSGSTLADSSGNGHDMTITGSPTLDEVGPAATEAVLWPADAGIHAGTTDTNTTSDASLECWVYVDDLPTGGTASLTGDQQTFGSVTEDKQLGVMTDGKVRWYVYDGSAQELTSTDALTLDAWHHIVASVGAAGMKIRVDKVAEASSGATTSYTGVGQEHFIRPSSARVGNADNGALTVTRVAFYETQLSDARVDAHYDAMTDGADPYVLDFAGVADGALAEAGWTWTYSNLVVDDGELKDNGSGGGVVNYDIGDGAETGVYLFTVHVHGDGSGSQPTLYFLTSGGFSSSIYLAPDVLNNRWNTVSGDHDTPSTTTLVNGDIWEVRVELEGGNVRHRTRPQGSTDWETDRTRSQTYGGSIYGDMMGIFLDPSTPLAGVLRFEYNPDPDYVPSDDVLVTGTPQGIDVGVPSGTPSVTSSNIDVTGTPQDINVGVLAGVPVAELPSVPDITIAFDSVGDLEVEDLILIDPTLYLSIMEPTTLLQAPSAITVIITGGQAGFDAVLDIDGTDLMTVELDIAGGLGPTTLSVSEALGAAGDHDVTATQTVPSGAVKTSTATFTVLLDPSPYPTPPDLDADPEDVPEAEVPGTDVRRWVLQDLAPDGLGSYILPLNPKEMTSPHFQRALTSKRTTASIRQGGSYHVFQASGLAKDWQFSGYAPTEEMCDKLEAYRDLNTRFYLIDHRNRAWQVVFTHVDIKPRLRHSYNGEITDWGSDYVVSATILDQNWSTPS
jgi:hypothetical protein